MSKAVLAPKTKLGTLLSELGMSPFDLTVKLRRVGVTISPVTAERWAEGLHAPQPRFLMPISKILKVSIDAILN